MVRQLLRAHEYWRLKLLAVDLIIINEQGATYADDLQGGLEALVRKSQSSLGHDAHGSHGGVFVLRGDQITEEDRILFQAVARVVLLGRRGQLADQVTRLERPNRPLARSDSRTRSPASPCGTAPSERRRSWSSSTGSAASVMMAVST